MNAAGGEKKNWALQLYFEVVGPYFQSDKENTYSVSFWKSSQTLITSSICFYTEQKIWTSRTQIQPNQALGSKCFRACVSAMPVRRERCATQRSITACCLQHLISELRHQSWNPTHFASNKSWVHIFPFYTSKRQPTIIWKATGVVSSGTSEFSEIVKVSCKKSSQVEQVQCALSNTARRRKWWWLLSSNQEYGTLTGPDVSKWTRTVIWSSACGRVHTFYFPRGSLLFE